MSQTQNPAVQNHQRAAKASVYKLRGDSNLLWNHLCQLVEAATFARLKQAGNAEVLSIGGRELGRLNRLKPGTFSAQHKELLRARKLGHIDPAGTLYLSLLRFPEGIRRRLRDAHRRAQ